MLKSSPRFYSPGDQREDLKLLQSAVFKFRTIQTFNSTVYIRNRSKDDDYLLRHVFVTIVNAVGPTW